MSELMTMTKKAAIVTAKLEGKNISEICAEFNTTPEYVANVISDAQAEAQTQFIRGGQGLLAFDLLRVYRLVDVYMAKAVEGDNKAANTVIKLLTLSAKILQTQQKTFQNDADPNKKEQTHVFGVNSDEYNMAVQIILDKKDKGEHVAALDPRHELENLMIKAEMLEQAIGGSSGTVEGDRLIDKILSDAEAEVLDEDIE